MKTLDPVPYHLKGIKLQQNMIFHPDILDVSKEMLHHIFEFASKKELSMNMIPVCQAFFEVSHTQLGGHIWVEEDITNHNHNKSVMKCEEISSSINHLVLEDEEDFGRHRRLELINGSIEPLKGTVLYHQVKSNTDTKAINRFIGHCVNLEGLRFSDDAILTKAMISAANKPRALKDFRVPSDVFEPHWTTMLGRALHLETFTAKFSRLVKWCTIVLILWILPINVSR
jgi:hypothetical protein